MVYISIFHSFRAAIENSLVLVMKYFDNAPVSFVHPYWESMLSFFEPNGLQQAPGERPRALDDE
jgi:hypothetical protein